MADQEIVDYTIKKLEKLLKPESFMIKDLDKFSLRVKKQEERLTKIIERIESLENRIRALEKENMFSKSD